MSLALIEGYSSAESEDDNYNNHYSSDEDHEHHGGIGGRLGSQREKNTSVFDFSKHPPAGSALPSAFDVFSEVRIDFALKNCFLSSERVRV